MRLRTCVAITSSLSRVERVALHFRMRISSLHVTAYESVNRLSTRASMYILSRAEKSPSTKPRSELLRIRGHPGRLLSIPRTMQSPSLRRIRVPLRGILLRTITIHDQIDTRSKAVISDPEALSLSNSYIHRNCHGSYTIFVPCLHVLAATTPSKHLVSNPSYLATTQPSQKPLTRTPLYILACVAPPLLSGCKVKYSSRARSHTRLTLPDTERKPRNACSALSEHNSNQHEAFAAGPNFDAGRPNIESHQR
jgi:hypothetical protein